MGILGKISKMLFLSFQLQFLSNHINPLYEWGTELRVMYGGHTASAMQCHAMEHKSWEKFGAPFY